MLSARRSGTKRKHAQAEPLDVDLTVRFRFGEEPDDVVTMVDNRRVPLVGSVFDKRDALVRGFVGLLLKASVTQPKVLSEILPALRLLRRNR